MSRQEAHAGPVETQPLPGECENHIKSLQPVVHGRAEKSLRPTQGPLARIPPVYGCDKLAADCIHDASKVSSISERPAAVMLMIFDNS
jgi:hypothetical protein